MLRRRPVISKAAQAAAGGARGGRQAVMSVATGACRCGTSAQPCVRGMPRHRAPGGQELLLRLSWYCRRKAQRAVRGVRLHAPRRRHLRRPGVDPQLEAAEAGRMAGRRQGGLCRQAHRRSRVDGAGRHAKRFKIPPELFEKLVYGTSLDLDIPPSVRRRAGHPVPRRLTTLSTIATTWLRSSDWFASGFSVIRTRKAEYLAEDCGLAFQLTNIIRDVKEDASMGRIYIPVEDLARTNLSAANFTPSALRTRAGAAVRPALNMKPIARANTTSRPSG